MEFRPPGIELVAMQSPQYLATNTKNWAKWTQYWATWTQNWRHSRKGKLLAMFLYAVTRQSCTEIDRGMIHITVMGPLRLLTILMLSDADPNQLVCPHCCCVHQMLKQDGAMSRLQRSLGDVSERMREKLWGFHYTQSLFGRSLNDFGTALSAPTFSDDSDQLTKLYKQMDPLIAVRSYGQTCTLHDCCESLKVVFVDVFSCSTRTGDQAGNYTQQHCICVVACMRSACASEICHIFGDPREIDYRASVE